MDSIAIIESLRRGEVPDTGFEKILVDRKDILLAIKSDMKYISEGNNAFKTRYFKGDFGSGKTFALKMLEKQALKENFAVSYIVLDEQDNRLDKLENIYRAIMTNLRVSNLPRGSVSLAEIFTTWNEIDFGTDAKKARSRLYKMTPGTAYLAVCLHAFYTKPEYRSQILSWVMREKTIPYSDKKEFHVKGDIDRTNCLHYLSSLTKIVTQSGYKGMIVIMDEVESILRLRKDLRLSALETIRLLDDNAVASMTNTGIYFAGTTDFFEGENGIRSYEALNSRLQTFSGLRKNYKQTILELETFEKKDRHKLLSNITKVYENAYGISLPDVSDVIIEKADSMAQNKKMSAREIVKRWVMYLDSLS